MLPNNLSSIANHLWQSTLFVAAVWLLTLMLRQNRAAVRYWLWLAASVKFLIPFSLLIQMGGRLGWRSAPAIAAPDFITVMAEVSRPFGVPMQETAPAVLDVSVILGGVWLCGVILGLVFWLRTLLRIRSIQQAATPLPLGLAIPVLSSSARMEPSVFGIWKPVLVMPAGIADRLTPAQLEAVLAHELSHVRRRDNLTAAIHLVVETTFWFYPLLMWIRTQLLAERERACDEEVIGAARDPRVYAQGILNVCKLYLESPLACVAGVTGADLKKRIAAIMAHRTAQNLDRARRLLLLTAGVATVAVPIAIGLINAPASQAQTPAPAPPQISYVASVRLNNAIDPRSISEYSPGGRYNATAATVAALLRTAYRIQLDQLDGAPDWIWTKRYDITAKIEDNPPPSQQVFLQALLKERFKLAVRREPRERPIFALTVARSDGKLGPQLTKSTFDCAAYFAGPHDPPRPDRTPTCSTRINLRALYGKAIPMSQLAASLAPFAGRFTVDKTGLAGGFDVELTWTPDQGTSSGGSGPSIFAAVQEQLGLKLVSEKGPVSVLIVDHLEEPSAN